MAEYVVWALVVVIVGIYAWGQWLLYFETPHDDGDPVVYVERGCRHEWSGRREVNYVTLVITREEVVLNDVLTFNRRGLRSAVSLGASTRSFKRAAVTDVSVGEFRQTPISMSFNLKISYVDQQGGRYVMIKSRDPRTVQHMPTASVQP